MHAEHPRETSQPCACQHTFLIVQSQQKVHAEAKLERQQLEQQAKQVAHQKQELSQEEARLASRELHLEVSA